MTSMSAAHRTVASAPAIRIGATVAAPSTAAANNTLCGRIIRPLLKGTLALAGLAVIGICASYLYDAKIKADNANLAAQARNLVKPDNCTKVFEFANKISDIELRSEVYIDIIKGCTSNAQVRETALMNLDPYNHPLKNEGCKLHYEAFWASDKRSGDCTASSKFLEGHYLCYNTPVFKDQNDQTQHKLDEQTYCALTPAFQTEFLDKQTATNSTLPISDFGQALNKAFALQSHSIPRMSLLYDIAKQIIETPESNDKMNRVLSDTLKELKKFPIVYTKFCDFQDQWKSKLKADDVRAHIYGSASDPVIPTTRSNLTSEVCTQVVSDDGKRKFQCVVEYDDLTT